MATFLFRADATPAMGTGHMMRCLALAEGLHDLGHACHFLYREATPSIERRLAAEGVATTRIEAQTVDLRAEATLWCAREMRADCLVVDGYQFDEDWRLAARAFERPILAFQDRIDASPLHADLVLNPAADPADASARHAAPEAIWLMGTEHVLLRREMRSAIAKVPLPLEERKSLLVTFGGSDPAGLTLPVLERIAQETPLPFIEVVIGGSVSRGPELAEKVSALGSFIRVHLDPREMGEIMRRSGLALSAAGSTMGELAALGVPAILAVVAENQEDSASLAASVGWCRSRDARLPGAAKALAEEALDLWQDLPMRREMAGRTIGLVDACGVARVCEALVAAATKP